MNTAMQGVLHGRCGGSEILALGKCATCYTLRRQDDEYFGGLREAVLNRDQYRCRVCDAPGRSKRSIIVHHRVPGRSVLHLMISVCPGCHAKVHRTRVVLSAMPPLLLKLYRAPELRHTASNRPHTSFKRCDGMSRVGCFVGGLAEIANVV